jgi:drug/metabolite transporter (DMT)-like permease
MNQRTFGVILMVGASICWSLSGIIVRNTSLSNHWEVVFWRSFFSYVFLAFWLGLTHGRASLAELRRIGWSGIASGIMFSVMITFFLLALTLTTVANTQAIVCLAPFMAAIAAWIFLRERPSARTWIAMTGALIGMMSMFVESLGSGRMIGNLVALFVPIAYGINVVILRKSHAQADMVIAVLIGSFISALVTLPLAWPFQASAHDLTLLAFMGVVQLAVGCILFVRATPHLTAVEISLIGLLESILAPLWVWWGVGERPSNLALAGGAIVIASLVLNEFITARRKLVYQNESGDAVNYVSRNKSSL